jgi:ATP-binding protein involved in chromosome partitioning
MAAIRHKIIVLSGKGGVGKSTVAANLALQLASSGKRVGLLDIDIHGPSIPMLLGLDERRPGVTATGMLPVEAGPNLRVMSIGFMLSSADAAIIWRGPLKMGAIKQFLTDVEWGELDYLVVDSPPGTGDEPLSIIQLIERADGAIIVTTPQDLALTDVRKCVNFCRKVGLPVLGVVENMSWLTCPHCGQRIDVFKSGGGRRMALEMGVPFLASIPLEPEIVERSDRGEPLPTGDDATPASRAFAGLVELVLRLDAGADAAAGEKAREDGARGGVEISDRQEKGVVSVSGDPVRIAIPVAAGKLSPHFGHCEAFALVDVEGGAIREKKMMEAPPHEPGALPRWLRENGANVIIAGGMGSRAQALFAESEIEVVIGAPSLSPEELVAQYLAGTLARGENICDH